MYMSALSAYISTYPEEGIRSHYKWLWSLGTELKTVPLTTKSSLQPLLFYLFIEVGSLNQTQSSPVRLVS